MPWKLLFIGGIFSVIAISLGENAFLYKEILGFCRYIGYSGELLHRCNNGAIFAEEIA
jgi:hypothetical protein